MTRFSNPHPLAQADEVDASQAPSTAYLEKTESVRVRKTHATEMRQAATDTRQVATEARQLATETSQAATETSQAATETRQAATETRQIATDDHRILLQQANERLVVTAVEAQILTEQLRATQSQLEIAKLIAEQANLAKSNFLSSMSHELRTPLNAILGFAQLLEIGSPPPTDTQMLRLQQIIKAGWYLLELINEILDLSVIEAGKISLSLESVSLTDLMRECQAMIEPLSRKNAIPISYLPFSASWFVYVDRTRLKQAIINLLSNAIKYNRAQGEVEVRCMESSPNRLRLCVKDSGAGLSAEQQTQLFQPFNRLGQESSSKEGTGIGLVVTKQLIELMGGSIGVKSTVGEGSEFWIELVRDTPHHETIASHL
jgi:signal transduction histidine kinase